VILVKLHDSTAATSVHAQLTHRTHGAHQFCASIEHAPQLLAFQTLSGGWFGIAMEYFPSAERILESNSLANYGPKWLAA
jgi:hypothetical protein